MQQLTRVEALTAFATAGCFSDDPDDLDPTDVDRRGNTVVEVRIIDNAFEPANVTVDRGTRVRWIRTTSTFHTVTPDGHSAWQRFATNVPSDTFEVGRSGCGWSAPLCSRRTAEPFDRLSS
jgi:plastocyanin